MLETIPEVQEDQELSEVLRGIVSDIDMGLSEPLDNDRLGHDDFESDDVFTLKRKLPTIACYDDANTSQDQNDHINGLRQCSLTGKKCTSNVSTDCSDYLDISKSTANISLALTEEESNFDIPFPSFTKDGNELNGHTQYDQYRTVANCDHDGIAKCAKCLCKDDIEVNKLNHNFLKKGECERGNTSYSSGEITDNGDVSTMCWASHDNSLLHSSNFKVEDVTYKINKSDESIFQSSYICSESLGSANLHSITAITTTKKAEFSQDQINYSKFESLADHADVSESCSAISLDSASNTEVAYNSSDIENGLECGSFGGELCNEMADGISGLGSSSLLIGCNCRVSYAGAVSSQCECPIHGTGCGDNLPASTNCDFRFDCIVPSNASNDRDYDEDFMKSHHHQQRCGYDEEQMNGQSQREIVITQGMSDNETDSLPTPLTRKILQCGEFVRRYSADSCCSDLSLDSAGTLVVSEVSTLCSDERSSCSEEDFDNENPLEFKCYGFHEGRVESLESQVVDRQRLTLACPSSEHIDLDLSCLSEREPKCGEFSDELSHCVGGNILKDFSDTSSDEEQHPIRSANLFDSDSSRQNYNSGYSVDFDSADDCVLNNSSLSQMLDDNQTFGNPLTDDLDDLFLKHTQTDCSIKIPCDDDVNIDDEYVQNLETFLEQDLPICDNRAETCANESHVSVDVFDLFPLEPVEGQLDSSHLLSLSNDFTDFDSYVQVQLLMARLKRENLIKEVLESGPVPTTTAGPVPGPGKKQLPAIPDPETQQALSNKMAATKASSPRSTNNSYGQFFVEYSILAEYNELRKQKLPGVYVIPSAKSALHWHGILFVRQGLYQEGIFRFSVQIPESYPDGESPRVIFDPPVFHPVIDPDTGELDVKRAIHKWRRNVHKIWQVLLYTRRIFFKIDTKNPLNAQAAKLYEQDIEMFKKKVTETVSLSKARLYDPLDVDDPHAIMFSPYDDNLHDDYKSQMFKDKCQIGPEEEEKSKNAQVSGLTWIKPGSTQVFSREDSATA